MLTNNIQRLQYKISDWKQATSCLSNNSKDLKISVMDYLHNADLEGRIISVFHPKYGILFCAVVNGRGSLLSESDESGVDLPFMTTAEILVQLEKFGFDIVYEEEPNLSGEQVDLLQDLYNTGFRSITKISVKYPKTSRKYVVAYMPYRSVDLLNFGTVVSKPQFDKYLEDGYVINVSTMKPSLKWDWLTYTCEIQDILDDNSKPGHYPVSYNTDPISNESETPYEEDFNPTINPCPVTFFNPNSDESSFHIYGDVEIVDDNVE